MTDRCYLDTNLPVKQLLAARGTRESWGSMHLGILVPYWQCRPLWGKHLYHWSLSKWFPASKPFNVVWKIVLVVGLSFYLYFVSPPFWKKDDCVRFWVSLLLLLAVKGLTIEFLRGITFTLLMIHYRRLLSKCMPQDHVSPMMILQKPQYMRDKEVLSHQVPLVITKQPSKWAVWANATYAWFSRTFSASFDLATGRAVLKTDKRWMEDIWSMANITSVH